MKKIGLIFVLLLAGCSEKTYEQSNAVEENSELYQDVLNVFKEDEDVKKVNVVIVDNKWLIAYEMNPFSQWQKQKHLKNIKKQLNKLKGDNDFIISNDFKLMWESGKLLRDSPDKKELQKEVKKLKKLLEEET